ncbi:hypothetical protein C5L25_001303 [Secundilactobacillus silagei JCM 19001]|uniref:Uncharacterized protein n=1 Tax=Secundilactobacillus silagei JCM 19001 TaxID=1302250 RepID=A0A1Z5IJ38_9LACO|nr:hypothetical protein C5L25_001303 [Secundilactobacillus silagei JCM 19001]GAX01785.1 hypothetical protein IWT126_01828 [Secundilactobacillus silagei JCM 19001]
MIGDDKRGLIHRSDSDFGIGVSRRDRESIGTFRADANEAAGVIPEVGWNRENNFRPYVGLSDYVGTFFCVLKFGIAIIY